jgi:hypothetical protein
LIERGNKILKDSGEFRSLDLDHEDFTYMLGMCAQVLFTPKLQRDHQVIPIAEEHGEQVVGCRSPAVKESELAAQLVPLFSLSVFPDTRVKTPMRSCRRQAGEGQRRTMAGANPSSGVPNGAAELRHEGDVVIAGQPLTGGPKVNSTQ